MKKLLQKIINKIIISRKYKTISKVEVFFVFGSKHKTAMCDWVYGIKIYSNLSFSMRDDFIKELQMNIRKTTDNFINQSVCCTDMIFEKI